jgi:hypothetical protein
MTIISDGSATHYVAADAEGRILFFGSVPTFMFAYQAAPEGGSLVLGVGTPETHYVKEGAVVARPANPTTLEGMTLKNVPAPCMVTVEGVDHACTDATVELSFSHPGTYTVKVDAWPMLDATFEVTQA